NAQAHSTSPAGFLGGIAAGFIAGYLILGMKKMFAGLPRSVEGMKPMLLYPVFGLLFIALIMYFIVNPIFNTINLLISHFLNRFGTRSLVLLSFVLAGIMSIDMRVSFNLAAYVFASGDFANVHQSTTAAIFLAAVMVGRMVRPFATNI